MADEEDIAALVIDNGSGMCKGKFKQCGMLSKDPSAATQGSESRPGARDTRHIVGRHCWESINKNSLARFGFVRLGGTCHRTHRRHYPLYTLRRHGGRHFAEEEGADDTATTPPLPSVSWRGRLSAKIGTKRNIQKYSDP